MRLTPPPVISWTASCWLSLREVMGCSQSGPSSEPEGDGDQTEVRLSPETRRLLKQSWTLIQQDVSRVGIITFVKLFETHPECKDVFFVFRDMEHGDGLRTSRELRSHGLRLMSFIEKTVSRMDQDDYLDQLILDLGRKHYNYSAPPKYYTLMGPEFIGTIRPILKDSWTPEVEEAWKTLFAYVTSTMKKGFVHEKRIQTSV